MSEKELLVKYGFVKNYMSVLEGKTEDEQKQIVKGLLKDFKKHADEESWEEVRGGFKETGFPKPLKRYRLSWEAPNLSMEGAYFWCLNYIEKDIGYLNTIKTIDAFSASENSAFFGVSQQRIGLQQDKVSQYLGTIGKMIKEIFQLVRELRIIDERTVYYKESFMADPKKREAAEITLKGIWVDMVEGGSKNPGSVFGMAREVQFTSLPDLFFSTHPPHESNVDEFVDKERGGFNKAVRNVLKRKLKMFLVWKEKTFAELRTRKIFTLKYLRQHYSIIKMYMTWVKPYLRHVKRLTLDEDNTAKPDIVSAFEGSMIDVEFLAYKNNIGRYHPCILATFNFRTRPSMSFQQEGYQRGPIHVGRLEMSFRAYVWTKQQIDNFKKFREREDLDMLRLVSGSVANAIDAMGGELEKYLDEAGEPIDKKEEEPVKALTGMDRLKMEFFGPSKDKKPKKPKKKKFDPVADSVAKKSATKDVKGMMFTVFKNFKKGHGMIMW